MKERQKKRSATNGTFRTNRMWSESCLKALEKWYYENADLNVSKHKNKKLKTASILWFTVARTQSILYDS